MAESVEELGYEISLGALQQQIATVESLRTRSTAVVATAGVAAGIIAAALKSSDSRPLEIVAFGFFVLGVVTALIVTLPRRGLVTSLNGARLVEAADMATDPSVQNAYRVALDELTQAIRTNGSVVSGFSTMYGISCVLVVLEIALGILVILPLR